MTSKRLKITTDCIGCVTCETLCSEVFVLADDGFAVVKEGADLEKNSEGIEDSIVACPTAAIIWEEENS